MLIWRGLTESLRRKQTGYLKAERGREEALVVQNENSRVGKMSAVREEGERDPSKRVVD